MAAPYVPASDGRVLAELPAGARHASLASRTLTAQRLDIALPLAQFDISQARVTGDLRFLGYAEAILAPWLKQSPVNAQILILHATILQSRHLFDQSVAEIDRALTTRPDDAQAWLTRATVLRVLGHYDAAMTSCRHLAVAADAVVTTICVQGVRGLAGHLRDAYQALSAVVPQGLAPQVQAWRYSELGDMAQRLGQDEAAEHWFREGLRVAPEDTYLRTACADLLLRSGRAAETLELLTGYESMEPMLLRVAIAHRALHGGAGSAADGQLSAAFAVEQRRGDAVHRREQARFLLDVERHPADALAAAQENWRVQREPDDVLILMRAAQAAHNAPAVASVDGFLKQTGLEDARLDALRRTP